LPSPTRSPGGIAGAEPGSIADGFFFSVQTMGTIGYGVMHPVSAAAETLVTAEVIVGVSLVALSSGMLFAKFSVPKARMQFAEFATIAPFDGVPTLMFRLGQRARVAGPGGHRPRRAAPDGDDGRGRHVLPHARPPARARALACDLALVERHAPASTGRVRSTARRRRRSRTVMRSSS
jgi:hypothetical protein